MVVASGSIAGKIFNDQVISLQGCRLDFRVGSTTDLQRHSHLRPLSGDKRTLFVRGCQDRS
jgi:hypothetical protein